MWGGHEPVCTTLRKGARGGARGGATRGGARGGASAKGAAPRGRGHAPGRGGRAASTLLTHRVLEAFELLLEATELLVLTPQRCALLELQANEEAETGEQARDHEAGDRAGSHRGRVRGRSAGAARKDDRLVNAEAGRRILGEGERAEVSNAFVSRQSARERHREPTRRRHPFLVQPTAASRELHVVNLDGRRVTKREREGKRESDEERKRKRERGGAGVARKDFVWRRMAVRCRGDGHRVLVGGRACMYVCCTLNKPMRSPSLPRTTVPEIPA